MLFLLLFFNPVLLFINEIWSHSCFLSYVHRKFQNHIKCYPKEKDGWDFSLARFSHLSYSQIFFLSWKQNTLLCMAPFAISFSPGWYKCETSAIFLLQKLKDECAAPHSLFTFYPSLHITSGLQSAVRSLRFTLTEHNPVKKSAVCILASVYILPTVRISPPVHSL